MLIALCAGLVLDLIAGDPLCLPHPVQLIGWVISRLEQLLRRLFSKTCKGELVAGGVLAALVCAVSFAVPCVLLKAAGLINPYLSLALECLMCWQVLAVKGLRTAGLRVYRPLAAGNLEEARRAVSLVVGRDTDRLDNCGVARAAVETVAENTGDGVVAPMLFFAAGGAPLAFLYKAVNTMDSMLGYKNDRYLYFGRAAARFDDAANFLPARLAGLFITAGAWLCRLDAGGAWRVMRRDRHNHQSPNSAWPEAACAGALGIQLGGASLYAGVTVPKPTIGDADRDVAPGDVCAAVRLELAAAFLCLFVCLFVRLAVILLIWEAHS